MIEEVYGDTPTNHGPCNLIRQLNYLQNCVSAFKSGGDAADAVVAQLEACRTILTDPRTMRLHVATDLLQVVDPRATLAAVLPPTPSEAQRALRGAEAVAVSFEQLRSSAFACTSSSFKPTRKVLGLSTAENSMLRQSAPGLGAHHPDLPALLVAIEYLTGLEGDFWFVATFYRCCLFCLVSLRCVRVRRCKIRGLGLSYGYAIVNSTESERLSFSLSRSTDPVEAHKAAKAIVASYCDGGTGTISDTALESTKSSVRQSPPCVLFSNLVSRRRLLVLQPSFANHFHHFNKKTTRA